MKYKVRSTRETLGYLTAKSEQEAWTKARLKWGMLVARIDAV
jgi:hypothetical protein